jgi:malonyl-CoA O-methyltransferase
MSLSKQLVRQHFDRHASEYDAHTPMQAEMGHRLLAHCDGLNPRRILELGCGTGRLTAAIHQRWPDADILAVDFARDMVDIAQSRVPGARFLHADAETLDTEPVDLVIANATVQWFADPAASLARVRTRQLAISTFASKTFCELRNCFEAVGESGRILPMLKVHAWREIAGRIGDLQVCEVRSHLSTYPTVRDFIDTVRRSGTSNAYSARPLRPSRWRQTVHEYESRYSTKDGVQATYEQLFLLIKL